MASPATHQGLDESRGQRSLVNRWRDIQSLFSDRREGDPARGNGQGTAIRSRKGRDDREVLVGQIIRREGYIELAEEMIPTVLSRVGLDTERHRDSKEDAMTIPARLSAGWTRCLRIRSNSLAR